MTIKLDAEIMYGFSGSVLSARYDQPRQTPDFHLELWKLCCSDAKRVAIAAPRGHAKTTAVTHAYVLASVLFRVKSNVLLISDTYEQAAAFLGNIKMELVENEILKKEFGLRKLIKDNEGEVIALFDDGAMFRITARGAGQSMRGTTWRNKRPDLVVCDDFENEELVSSPERRDKFKDWFMGAVLPMGGESCQIRIVGTVLHQDSQLENFLNSPKSWVSRRFAAHNEDMTEILWEDRFPKEYWVAEMAMFAEAGKLDVYSREYLNVPISADQAFFKEEMFLPITNPEEPLNYFIAADLAASTKTKADFTVFVVAGMNAKNVLKVPLVIRERMDSKETIDTLFRLYRVYKPQWVRIEGGPIGTAMLPLINAEMLRRNVFMDIDKLPPVGDKRTRAQAIRARMAQGAVQFDTKAAWFPPFKAELLIFDRGKKDDQVDAMAYLGLMLDKMNEAPTEEEIRDEEYEEFAREFQMNDGGIGIDRETGY